MPSKITLLPEISELIVEAGGGDAYKCYQCGKCMGICPWSHVERVSFPAYRVPQSVKLGTSASSEDKDELAKEIDEVFRCVSCESCFYECPHGVSISTILMAIRRLLVDYGMYPDILKPVVSSLKSTGNPLGQPREKRREWAKDLSIPDFGAETEFLYFPGCFPAYDPRCQPIAQFTAQILKKGDVSFGILGNEEYCCGEAIRRVGAEKRGY